MGFEAGKVYAAYDCKMSKGIIFQGEYKFAEGFDNPSILAGFSMRETVGGVELYAPWGAEIREEVPTFILDAFPKLTKTNRDRLMAELEALSNDELYSIFADNRLTRALDDGMCDDCKTRYGRCMSTSDGTPCPFTLSEWLDMTAQPGASILPAR